MKEEIKQNIFELIAKNRLRDAIQIMDEVLTMDDACYADFVMIKRRIIELEANLSSGMISMEDSKIEKNIISKSLLDMVRDISKTKVENQVDKDVITEEEFLPPGEDFVFHNSLEREDSKLENIDSNSLKGYQRKIEYKGSLSAKEKEFLVNKPYELVFEKSLSWFEIRKINVLEIDKSLGFIEGRTKSGFLSVGEKIMVYIREMKADLTQLHVISDSVLFTTVTTWGKNAGHIDKFEKSFKE